MHASIVCSMIRKASVKFLALQDAEVLLILYDRLGTTLLPKLRGEFAFCVFDSRTVRCHLRRKSWWSIDTTSSARRVRWDLWQRPWW